MSNIQDIVRIDENLLEGKILLAVSTSCWRTNFALNMEQWQRETLGRLMREVDPNVSPVVVEAVLAAKKLAEAVASVMPEDQAKQIAATFEEQRRRFKLKSDLIDPKCGEYNNIVKYVARGKEEVMKFSVPFPMLKRRAGIALCRADLVEQVAAIPERVNKTLRESPDLIPLLVANWERLKNDARAWLGNNWDERSYPTAESLPSRFFIETQFIDIRPAEGLPSELRKQEFAKFQTKVAAAAEEVVVDLRTMASGIIDTMVSRLRAEEKDGKQPRLYGTSLLTNLTDFIDTFDSKNVFNDAALADTIAKAKEITKGLDVDKLKDSEALRRKVATDMEEVQAAVGELVKQATRTRRFTLDED